MYRTNTRTHASTHLDHRLEGPTLGHVGGGGTGFLRLDRGNVLLVGAPRDCRIDQLVHERPLPWNLGSGAAVCQN